MMPEVDEKNAEIVQNASLSIPVEDETSTIEVATTESAVVKKRGNGFRRAMTRVGEVSARAYSTARDRAQVYSERREMRKLNPLFREQYQSPEFNLPNVIQIVDDAVRRDIDLCQGAIGWRDTVKGVEILYLYDEAIEFSGLSFDPAPVCDSVYYVDPHRRDLFINVDGYFDSMQQKKLAELQRIADSLGAIHYWVEMVDASEKSTTFGAEVNQEDTADENENPKKGKKKTSNSHGGMTVTPTMKSEAKSHKKIVASASFSGSRRPVQPELCWFAHDDNVQNLIRMRCNGRKIQEYNITLTASSTSSMSIGTAIKVNEALTHMKLTCNFAVKSQEEHSHNLIFKLEF